MHNYMCILCNTGITTNTYVEKCIHIIMTICNNWFTHHTIVMHGMVRILFHLGFIIKGITYFACALFYGGKSTRTKYSSRLPCFSKNNIVETLFNSIGVLLSYRESTLVGGLVLTVTFAEEYIPD